MPYSMNSRAANICKTPHIFEDDIYGVVARDVSRQGCCLDPGVRNLISTAQSKLKTKSIQMIRTPGLRDQITTIHPIALALAKAGLTAMVFTGKRQANDPPIPAGQDQIRVGVCHRYWPLFARGTDLKFVYTNDKYYDADHVADEILNYALDWTLPLLIKWLVAIEKLNQPLFRAIWVRDWQAIEAFIDNKAFKWPKFGGLKRVKLGSDRARLAIGFGHEFERGFELLAFIAGQGRVTKQSLAMSMTSKQSLMTDMACGRRDASYAINGWMHRMSLEQFYCNGAGYYPAYHPYAAYAGSNPFGVDPIRGALSPPGFDTMKRSVSVSPPFANNRQLSSVRGVFPAHFLYGQDALELAISIPLSLARERPSNAGSPGRGTKEKVKRLTEEQAVEDAAPGHERPSHDSVFGRLGILMLSNICPHTAWAAMISHIGLARENNDDLKWPFNLRALVSNPVAWAGLYDHTISKKVGSALPASPTARESYGLGPNFLGQPVRSVRAKLRTMYPPNEDRINQSQAFFASNWWVKGAHDKLRRSYHCAPKALKMNLPSLFQIGEGPVLEYCIDIAEKLWAGSTPLSEDPYLRDYWQIVMDFKADHQGAQAAQAAIIKKVLSKVPAHLPFLAKGQINKRNKRIHVRAKNRCR